MARAPPGGGSPVVALAVPAGDVASSGGGLDAKVRLSFGKPRRRGVGRRLTLAPAPAEHDVPGVVFGFGTPVDELSSAEEDEDGGVGDGSSAAWMGTGARKMAARRPWRGPLPPARVSPHLTLADVLARARTFHGHAGRGHAPGVLLAHASTSSPAHASASSPAPSCVSAGGRTVSSFLASRPGMRVLGDRSAGPGRAIVICVEGRKAHFTFTDGLCGLFGNAGRPRGFSSPARAPSDGVHPLASAIQVAASSPLEPVVVQAKFGAKTKSVVAMDRRGAGGHGRGSDRDVACQGRGGGHGVDPGLFHGGGGGEFQGSNLGFDPGYGGDDRDRGWQRGGFRPRGSRGFAPRRGVSLADDGTTLGLATVAISPGTLQRRAGATALFRLSRRLLGSRLLLLLGWMMLQQLLLSPCRR
jgi:hypothetical protein